MESYSKADIIKLYEDLKDVNLKDYVYTDEDENPHMIGAVSGPISLELCERTCKIIDLFDKELFHLFTGIHGYNLSNRIKSKYAYSFNLYEDRCVYIIFNLESKTITYGDTIKYKDVTDSEFREVAKEFIDKVRLL